MRAPNKPINIPKNSNGLGSFVNLIAVTILNIIVLVAFRAFTGPSGPIVHALLIAINPRVLIIAPIIPIMK